ncbi:MAG TPA: HD domain-containing protein [Marmoricola sp.]|nr:HD domain-containing protein [Marmoricola sp.]
MKHARPDPAALAKALLAPDMQERYWHVAAVASRARSVNQCLAREDSALVAAAWLHDIGYAASVRSTGFHPLDGARYLARSGFDPQVVSLVAFHSAAAVEARLRGLHDELADEFHPPDRRLLDLLTFCDMTTGPQGQSMTVDDRLEEILARYRAEDVVHQAISLSAAQLRTTVREVDDHLAAQSQ